MTVAVLRRVLLRDEETLFKKEIYDWLLCSTATMTVSSLGLEVFGGRGRFLLGCCFGEDGVELSGSVRSLAFLS